MKKENKKLLSIFVVAIVVSAAVATALIFGMKYLEEGGEEEQSIFAKIFVDESSGTIPFDVNFTTLILYYEGDITYEWDFGDGNTSTERSPTYIYDENGSFLCTLTITDSNGEKVTDSIMISAKPNQGPTVSIVLSDLRPSRPFIPLLRRPQISGYYWGRTLRELMDKKIIPSSLLNREGFVSCNARASSPEGSDIVSYRWELRPPTYSTRLGQQKKPVYTFEGKNITIPMLYTYVVAPYDLTVTVTDSKGFEGTSTIKFQVEESGIETQLNALKQGIGVFRQNVWHDILKEQLSGPAGSLVYETIFSRLPSWPLLKLAIVFQLGSKWAINPEGALTIQLLKQLLEKHPRLQNVLQKNLVRIQSLLEKKVGESAKLAPLYEKVIDAIQVLLEQLGLANLKPEISDEKPENNAQLVNASIPQISITVTDPEGDPFNVSIHGKYLNDTLFTNQYNNTFNATFFSTLPYETDIYWYVNVSSQGRWVNRTYMFTTRWL